jgi:hypothetical protein
VKKLEQTTTQTKTILWSLNDSPPKKGEIIENFWHEKFKVISRRKIDRSDMEITLEKI